MYPYKFEVNLSVAIWNIILSLLNAKCNCVSYKIFTETLNSHEEIQKLCQQKRGTPACFKRVTLQTREYMLQLLKDFKESQNTTTSTAFQFAYIGLIKTNSGILIWWDRTEVDENSTFPLYIDNLESTCGSLRFIENETDPILIALYNCSANLPYICEFEDFNQTTEEISTTPLYVLNAGYFHNVFWIAAAFGLAIVLLLFMAGVVSLCRPTSTEDFQKSCFRRTDKYNSALFKGSLHDFNQCKKIGLVNVLLPDAKTLKPILKKKRLIASQSEIQYEAFETAEFSPQTDDYNSFIPK